MSGGSYMYLYAKDSGRLLAGEGREDLERMRDRLLEAGAMDAAAQTDAVIATIEQANALVNMRIEALEAVWKAVEWVDSCDWGPERIEEALAKYRSPSS